MINTKALATTELTLRILREREHARRALARLASAQPSDRMRREGHGTERSTSRYWRRARRHLRNIARAEALLAALEAA